MVEIIVMFRVLKYAVCFGFTLLLGGVVYAQQPPLQVEPRIAGLEGNEEYMSLLREDARLQNREDSITGAVDQVRRQLRENPEARQQLSQQIMQLENQIFEVRNAKGRLIDRINTIEQDWVLANLDGEVRLPVDGGEELAPEIAVIPDSQKVRNLVDNLYFREQLPAEDYAALQRAQHQELLAVDYLNRYFANYTSESELAEAYAAAQTEPEALDLYGRYKTLSGLNRVLADSLAQTWNYIFDNKSYAYGYLLDKLNQEPILAREEEQISEAARQLSTLQDQVASPAVADYFLRKRVVVDYETALADLLELKSAGDSLRGVAAQIASIDYRLPKIEVAERTFMDFDSLQFSSAQQYSYQNPIPECRVYARGTIYRILLGKFNTKRAASTFKGTYPLCYQINADDKWCYYAGGFATKEEAEQAQAQLKSRGFMRPEIVVWNDGEERNLSRDTDAPAVVYRVEINGVEALPDAIKQLIAENAEGRELSRVGQQLFVVGMFDDRAVAERLAAAMRENDPSLEIIVAEISE